MIQSSISFTVSRPLVKLFKDKLEASGNLDKKAKIEQATSWGCLNELETAPFQIHSTIRVENSNAYIPRLDRRARTDEAIADALKRIGLLELRDLAIHTGIRRHSAEDGKNTPSTVKNPVTSAVSQWLHDLPSELLSSIALTPCDLLSTFPSTYTIYPPLLLLPPHAFPSGPWTTILASIPQIRLTNLYTLIAEKTNVTHIAVNAGIPPTISSAHPSAPLEKSRRSIISHDPRNQGTHQDPQLNFLRSPTNFQPLHGNFGPDPPIPHPTEQDFASALWVSTTHHGIAQTWAPQHTMFSRGNVREKARLLKLESVRQAIRQGKEKGCGCSAVDLYAGIGYFSFCYKKAGVRCVLGWELSAWSVEAFRRGVEMNRWSASIVDGKKEKGESGLADREEMPNFILFREDNTHAGPRIKMLRNRIPPVRHVNCGLLPTSRGSWETALEVLDPVLGGWMHVHENIAVKEVDVKAMEVLAEVQGLAEEHWRSDEEQRGGKGIEAVGATRRVLRLEQVERVKTYAPGVMHCVLDIFVPPPAGVSD